MDQLLDLHYDCHSCGWTFFPVLNVNLVNCPECGSSDCNLVGLRNLRKIKVYVHKKRRSTKD